MIKSKNIKRVTRPFSPFQTLFATGGVTFLFRIGGLGLSFLVTYIINFFFGADTLGKYTIAFTLCQAFSLFFGMGMPNAMISYLGLKKAEENFSQALLRRGLKIVLLVCIIPFLILFFGGGFIAGTIFSNNGLEPYLAIAALTVPVMAVHELLLNFFTGTGNFMKFNLCMFIVPNTVFILLLVCFRHVPGYYSLVFYLASVAVVLLAELYMALKAHDPSGTESPTAWNMVKYSSPMMLSSIMLFLLNWTDVFMLGAMVPETEVAYYNIAYKIASLSMLVIVSMNIVLAPRIAELFNGGRLDELHATVKKTTHLVIAFTLPAVVLLLLLAGFLLSLYGEDFLQGKTALMIIAVGFLLNATAGNVDQVLNMTGNQKLLQNITIAGFLFNVSLNYLLIPQYGINGAAMASLITNVLFNCACVLLIKKKLGFYTFI